MNERGGTNIGDRKVDLGGFGVDDNKTETQALADEIRRELASLKAAMAAGKLTEAEYGSLSWRMTAMVESHAASFEVLKNRFETAKRSVRSESGVLIAQAEAEMRRRDERGKTFLNRTDNVASEAAARAEIEASEKDSDDSNDAIFGFNKKLGNYSVPVKTFEARLKNNDIKEINSRALAEYLAYLGRKGRIGELKNVLSNGNARGLAMLWGMNAAENGGKDILSSSRKALKYLKEAAGNDFESVVAGVKDAVVQAIAQDAANARFKEAAVAVLRSEGIPLGEEDVKRIAPCAEAFSKHQSFENLTALFSAMGLGKLNEEKREGLAKKLLEANKISLLDQARELEKTLWAKLEGSNPDTAVAEELGLRRVPDGFAGKFLMDLEAKADGNDQIKTLEDTARQEKNYGALMVLGNLRALILKRDETRRAAEMAKPENAAMVGRIVSDEKLAPEEKSARLAEVRARVEEGVREGTGREREMRRMSRKTGVSPRGGIFEISLDAKRSEETKKAFAAADGNARGTDARGGAEKTAARKAAGWKEGPDGSRTRKTPEGSTVTISSDGAISVLPAGAENPVVFDRDALREKWEGNRGAMREDIRSTAELARDTGFLSLPEGFRKEAVRIWNSKVANSGGKFCAVSVEDGLSTDGSHLEKKSLVALMELVTSGKFFPESAGLAARARALKVGWESAGAAALLAGMAQRGIVDGGSPRKAELEKLVTGALSGKGKTR